MSNVPISSLDITPTFHIPCHNTYPNNPYISPMDRKRFIKNITLGTIAMGSLGDLAKAMDHLLPEEKAMPALFIGHGSPTNSVEDNEFTRDQKSVV